jgi:hypothetical protein
MRIRRSAGINLRHLILLLAVFSAAVMLAGGMAGAYQVQRQQLMASTLDANEAFATKLARTTSDLLLRAQNNLAYAAGLMVRSGMTPAVQQAEVERLRHLELGFNAVTVVDMQGVVRAASPESLGLKGRPDRGAPAGRDGARADAGGRGRDLVGRSGGLGRGRCGADTEGRRPGPVPGQAGRAQPGGTGGRPLNAKAPPFGGALLPLWAAAPHGSGAKSTP